MNENVTLLLCLDSQILFHIIFGFMLCLDSQTQVCFVHIIFGFMLCLDSQTQVYFVPTIFLVLGLMLDNRGIIVLDLRTLMLLENTFFF